MLLALCVAVAVGSGIAPSAVAQTGCPPGQTFIPTLNRCIASGNAPGCPPGTRYDANLRRCLGIPQNKCAEGETFERQQNACVAAPK
jgi:hypothetical protein